MRKNLKGEFLLYQKKVAPNLYALTHEKVSFLPYYFLIIFIFFFLLLFAIFYKIPELVTINGIYSCEDTCTLTSYLPYEIVKKLKTNNQLRINEQKISITKIEFGELQQINQIYVEPMKIEIPQQDYFEKETIEFSIILDEKPFFKILYHAMKGGD